jgi:hypothetical protein
LRALTEEFTEGRIARTTIVMGTVIIIEGASAPADDPASAFCGMGIVNF